MAYVAGLLDGEGSIVIGVGKTRKGSPQYWLQVGITNTDRPLIDWLHQNLGGHISDNSHSPSRRRMRPCWVWRVMSNEAAAFLLRVTPHLRVKRQQAEIAVAFQKHMRTAKRLGPKSLSPEEIAVREAFRTRLRALTLGAHSM